MKLLPSLPALSILLLSCGDGATDSSAPPAADSLPSAGAGAVDLSTHGLPLLLKAPDEQLTGGAEAAVTWKEETGRWEVLAGDHFGITITEEPGDIPRLKADLERDLLRKNTLLTEAPDRLVFRSEFPDDPSLVHIHFYQVVTAGDRTFIVQDMDGRAYNQQDIDRMLVAVVPKQPA